MKKFIKTVSAAVLSVAMVGCGSGSAPASSGVSGTFKGTGVGMGGESNPVTVTVTLKDSVITEVVAEGPGETPAIAAAPIEQLPAKMVEANSINVDAVSGATVTSNAIKDAAAAALKEAGLNPEDYMGEVAGSDAQGEDVTKDVDVVVVGAGGAGMVAAITAADAGKSVIILESQAMAGGNSVRATGGMNAAKTVYQDENEFAQEKGLEATLAKAEAYTGANEEFVKQLTETVKQQWIDYQAAPEGYFDSAELFELDTMLGGKGINNPELVETLVANSSDAIDWLDSIGITLHNVSSFGGASVMRIHRPVNDEGKVVSVGNYMIPVLQDNLNSRNIEVLYNTTVDTILMDGDKAVGVSGTKDNGASNVTVNAKAVVLATGGFGANNDMVVAQNHPELKGYITTNAAGAMGQGIVMAEEVGAATVDMDQIQLHPTVHVAENGSANLITEGLRGDGAILVNKEGLRFTDEVGTRDKVSDAENNQTDGMAWLIVDQEMYDASAVIQGYVSKGWTVQGETIEDLAKAMEVDENTLATTLETWNGYVEKTEDPEFGRTSFKKPLNGPFYALTVQPGIHHTMGGLEINSATEVLNTDGNAISGLFAAGEITGGVHGANRLGGNAVADFVVFGRIAGQSAADFAK